MTAKQPLSQDPLILLVDDDRVALELCARYLRRASYDNLILCEGGEEVLSILSREPVDALLLDLSMPRISGQEVLEQVGREHPAVPVVILTAADDVETAVACMKKGAFDFMSKPVEGNRLLSVVRHALETRELQRQVNRLTRQVLGGELEQPEAFSEIVTASDAMQSVFRYVEAVARSPKSALITGESGTGKELIARAIYRLSDERGEFVSVNVSGLDDTVFSDTLFGHRRGAFTGAETERKGLVERAAGGILFLDEIGDLEPGSQVKLLRLLQEREYYPLGSDEPRRSRTRVIAATNSDLKRKQETGAFRKDLYFRLVAHHVHLPPLRERLEDIPPLVEHFVREACSSLSKRAPHIPRELFSLLRSFSFPGNVRELQSLIYDAVSRHRGTVLSLSAFRDYMEEHRPAVGEAAGAGQAEPAAEGKEEPTGPRLSYSGPFPRLSEVEDFFIREALTRSGGNQTTAARLLGISQSTLSRRLSAESRELNRT